MGVSLFTVPLAIHNVVRQYAIHAQQGDTASVNRRNMLENDMSNFFNGADSAEVAGLNLSNSNLNIIVKQYLSVKDNVDTQKDIANGDMGPFEREVEMCMQAMEECPEMREYPLDDVRSSISRRMNSLSQTIAKNHGFTTYLKLNRGKVQKADIAIEHKPQ